MAPQVKYSSKEKILSIRISPKKSVDSDVKDNIVVDYDSQGEIVNIDIMKINMREFSKIRQSAMVGVESEM